MVLPCEINCDIGRSGVDGTSGGDGPTADVHNTYGMAQTPLVRFLVDLLYNKLYNKLCYSNTTVYYGIHER